MTVPPENCNEKKYRLLLVITAYKNKVLLIVLDFSLDEQSYYELKIEVFLVHL